MGSNTLQDAGLCSDTLQDAGLCSAGYQTPKDFLPGGIRIPQNKSLLYEVLSVLQGLILHMTYSIPGYTPQDFVTQGLIPEEVFLWAPLAY